MRDSWIAPTLVVVLNLCPGPVRSASAQQINDPAFSTRVANPAHHSVNPRVGIDASHENVFVVHTDRLDPLVGLMTADGMMVDTLPDGLSARALRGIDVLVVLTARRPFKDVEEAAARSPFSAHELSAMRTFVGSGGGLLFCVDHTPFGSAGMELAAQFGVTLVTGIVSDSITSGAWQHGVYVSPIYSRKNGGLADHPIVAGRDSAEAIEHVAVFGGISMAPPDGAVPLFRVSPSAFNSGERGEPMSGLGTAQAVALTYGRGRVVITGDCSMWTAQILDPEGSKVRFGMARTELDNRQFALNVLRWLSGAL